MAFWDNWISTLLSRDKEPNPIIEHSAESSSDEPEAVDETSVSEFLDGIYIGIYYRDAKGARSSRSVTAQDIIVDNGRAYLRGICHMRHAYRMFRCDRIDEIYSADGEVFEPETFWRQLGVPETILDAMQPSRTPSSSSPSKPRSPKPPLVQKREAPGRAHRRLVRHQIRLLAALARADGKMATEEVDQILEFICCECDMAAIPFNDEDLTALRNYVTRLRPTAEKVNESLAALFSDGDPLSETQLRSLYRAMRSVADADGVLDPAEFEFLQAFEQWAHENVASPATPSS